MRKIEIHEYSPVYKDEWDNFVLKSNNGTMFHRQAFLDYHPEGKFNFHHLMLRLNGKLIGLLPGGLSEGGKIFWSPVGASYGSIVTGDIHFELALNMVDSVLDYFSANAFKEIFLIPPPIMYNRTISQNLEYAMLYRRFDFELHYISHAIDLRNKPESPAFFDKTSRKTIHKILRDKELRIVESDDYASFNDILLSNKARHGVKPTHSLDDMLRLQKLLPDNVILLMVYYDEKPIAGSWLFKCNSKVMLCFYNMLYYEFEHLKPVYLIMHETVRMAVEGGYDWVDIGVSQDTKSNDPMTPSLGLINFKERFNSRGILRSTFHYKFGE